MYKKKRNKTVLKGLLYFYFFTRGAQNGLHVHIHITQLCIKKDLARLLRLKTYCFYFTCKLLNMKSQFLLNIDFTGIILGFQTTKQKGTERIKFRWVCNSGNWNVTSTTNPTYRIIFGQPLVHFMTAMWWSNVMLKPHVKMHIQGHIFNSPPKCVQRKLR